MNCKYRIHSRLRLDTGAVEIRSYPYEYVSTEGTVELLLDD